MDGGKACSKCLLLHLPCSLDDNWSGQKTVSSPLEPRASSICQNIHEHLRLDMLPPYPCQLIFDRLVRAHHLTDDNLGFFQKCYFSLIHLGGYPGVRDSWMNVIASQGESLESLDISCSDVTDRGFVVLKDCFNLRNLALNYCYHISDRSLGFISRFSRLMSLSIIRNNGLTAEGMKAFTNLRDLVNLNLERCSRINGGLIHLRGLTKLKSLNIKYCISVTDEDMEPLSGLTNLKELKMSCPKVTDLGVAYLEGLRKLSHLDLQGCSVTSASLGTISGFTSLLQLNLSRCSLSDEGCEKLSELIQLKDLYLEHNRITNACLINLKGLMNLESLSLVSCNITCEGLLNIKGLTSLRTLELSETRVKSEGLSHLSGLHSLEHLNLSFTLVNSTGLAALSTLTSLKSLNLDTLDIPGVALPFISSLIGLTRLDVSGWLIFNFALDSLKCFKNLQSLEICSGFLIDDHMDIIGGLTSLKLLNLSNNFGLTDMALDSFSGLTALCLLNISHSSVTNTGLIHLTPLKNLRSLYLDFTKVTAAQLRRLQAHVLPNLVTFRPC